MNRQRKPIWIILFTALFTALLLGCGWDSTPKLVIPTPAPSAQTNTARPRPGDGSAAGTDASETADPNATPGADDTQSPDSGETPDPNATPTVVPAATIDPNLIGLWEFKYCTYKGATSTAKDTGHSIVFRFYSNGSATNVIDNTETTGLQFSTHGSTLTLTLYGETMFTLIYDGTNIIWEQAAFGDYADLYFEKTGA